MKSLKRITALMLICLTVFAFSACNFDQKQYLPSEESYFKFTAVEGGYEVSAKDVENLPETLNLPETYNDLAVVKVADYGFSGAKIKDLAIPKNIKVIGAHAFETSTLENVYFYTGVQEIGDAAFYGCSSLAALNLPKSVTTLGQSAFASCVSIKSVVLPEKVTTVGNACFGYCLSLDSVYIPRSVEYIGVSAFVGCSDTVSFKISSSNEYYKLDENGYPVEK